MHRRGPIVGLSNHLKGGLRLYIGSKNTELSSFPGLAGSHSASWKYQTAAFSSTRSSFTGHTPSPGGCDPAQRFCGHPKLPWKPEVQLVGRDDALQKVQRAVEGELSQTCADRNLWHVAYAAGRAGSGKTEIGKQLPRILARNLRKHSERALLSNSAYLLIDCNGGGDRYEAEDKPLKPQFRLGWRLLAAVCRDTINLKGLTKLRWALEEKGPTSVAQQLDSRGFPNVAELVKATLTEATKKANLEHPIAAEAVLRALARDLRRNPNSNERVAIIVHVDEHQLMWGEGLPDGVSDEDHKLKQHKEFLYDLCTLRGDGDATWCRENNIFMFPIFTGTASAILASLLGPTNFTKLHLKFEPFSAEDARTLFLRVLKPNRGGSWLKKNTSHGKPMDFVLSELGRIPRLIINAANDTRLRQLFTHECKSSPKAKKQKKMVRTEDRLDVVHQAFDIVQTLYPGSGLSEQLTRLIVAGVEVDMNTIVDGRTIAQHEYEGYIIQHSRVDLADAAAKPGETNAPQKSNPAVAKLPMFAIRVPATEYRASVIGRPGLLAISAFANLDYSCPGWKGRGRKCTPWSELFEKMMMERFQNMLVVHRDILKRTTPLTIEELYPACCASSGNMGVPFKCPLPEVLTIDTDTVGLCDQTWSYKDKEWAKLLGALEERGGISKQLEKDHPAFDMIHVLREGKVVRCFLEQVKNRDSPTRDLLSDETLRSQRIQETSESVCDGLDKFLPVMVQMTKAAKDRGLELQFIPVYCDRRMPTDDDVLFWSGFWKKRGEVGELTIAASVAGSRMAIPSLFPCLEHRFVLLEEPSLKPLPDTDKGVGKVVH
jgi:hypothetical protein